MATLNIKNLPDGLYRRLQQRARRHHRSTAQEVTQILSDILARPEPLSILEMRGLGRELWSDSSPAEHVDRERGSWD